MTQRTDSMTAEHGQRSQALRGQRVALTGALISMPRAEAVALVRRCGGEFSAGVGRETTLLVVGEQGWPLKSNGRLTNKLQQAHALRRQGCSLEILGEEAFLQRLGLHQQAESVCRTYSLVELVRLLGVSRRQLQALINAGLVEPLPADGGLPAFDFRQVTRVRGVLKLVSSGTAIASIRRSLTRLRRSLPDASEPLDWLARLEVQEKRLVVRSVNGDLREPTGQMLLDFSEAGGEPTLRFQGDRFEEAVALEEKGRFREAVAAYRGILADEGPHVAVSFNLANALYAAGEKEAAAERFRQVTEADPEFAEAWNNLGLVLAELGEAEEAIAAVRRAVAANSAYADARYALADLLDEAGRADEARPHWEAFLVFEGQGPHADHARRRIMNSLSPLGRGPG